MDLFGSSLESCKNLTLDLSPIVTALQHLHKLWEDQHNELTILRSDVGVLKNDFTDLKANKSPFAKVSASLPPHQPRKKSSTQETYEGNTPSLEIVHRTSQTKPQEQKSLPQDAAKKRAQPASNLGKANQSASNMSVVPESVPPPTHTPITAPHGDSISKSAATSGHSTGSNKNEMEDDEGISEEEEDLPLNMEEEPPGENPPDSPMDPYQYETYPDRADQLDPNTCLEIDETQYDSDYSMSSDTAKPKPSDEPSGKPSSEPSEKPSSGPSNKPSDKRSDKPPGKPSDKAADKVHATSVSTPKSTPPPLERISSNGQNKPPNETTNVAPENGGTMAEKQREKTPKQAGAPGAQTKEQLRLKAQEELRHKQAAEEEQYRAEEEALRGETFHSSMVDKSYGDGLQTYHSARSLSKTFGRKSSELTADSQNVSQSQNLQKHLGLARGSQTTQKANDQDQMPTFDDSLSPPRHEYGDDTQEGDVKMSTATIPTKPGGSSPKEHSRKLPAKLPPSRVGEPSASVPGLASPSTSSESKKRKLESSQSSGSSKSQRVMSEALRQPKHTGENKGKDKGLSGAVRHREDASQHHSSQTSSPTSHSQSQQGAHFGKRRKKNNAKDKSSTLVSNTSSKSHSKRRVSVPRPARSRKIKVPRKSSGSSSPLTRAQNEDSADSNTKDNKRSQPKQRSSPERLHTRALTRSQSKPNPHNNPDSTRHTNTSTSKATSQKDSQTTTRKSSNQTQSAKRSRDTSDKTAVSKSQPLKKDKGDLRHLGSNRQGRRSERSDDENLPLSAARDQAEKLSTRASMCCKGGRFEEAIEYYDKAIKLFGRVGDNTSAFHCYINVANCYGSLKNWDGCKKSAREAIKLDHSSAKAYSLVAWALEHQDLFKDAVEMLQSAKRRYAPDDERHRRQVDKRIKNAISKLSSAQKKQKHNRNDRIHDSIPISQLSVPTPKNTNVPPKKQEKPRSKPLFSGKRSNSIETVGTLSHDQTPSLPSTPPATPAGGGWLRKKRSEEASSIDSSSLSLTPTQSSTRRPRSLKLHVQSTDSTPNPKPKSATSKSSETTEQKQTSPDVPENIVPAFGSSVRKDKDKKGMKPGNSQDKDSKQNQSSGEDKYKSLLQSKTLPQLKELLKEYDEDQSGSKQQLVERCYHFHLNGCTPVCGKCGVAKLRFDKPSGYYVCSGGFRSAVGESPKKCKYKSKDVPMSKFVIK